MIALPPSLPENIISLSAEGLFIKKLPLEAKILPNVLPEPFKCISSVPESILS